MTLAALFLLVSALAGCTAATAPQAAEQTPEPSGTAIVPESENEACSDPAWIGVGSMKTSVRGVLVDLGSRELAAGVVGLDNEGKIVSYTVAAGDAPYAIGERLCIANPLELAPLNHTRNIHPGQVLRLDSELDVRWIPYFNPDDAPAGFQQIPYQYAIEAMGTAADAGDIDTMRSIWTEELFGMFTDPDDIEAIQQALDAGDMDVLVQMFS